MQPITRSIDSEFVVMSPDKQVSIEPWDPGLYERLDKQYGSFAGHELIACHSFDSDWPTWEIHPHGDEVVLLLDGEATFLIKMPGGETTLTLETPGDYVVVPRNTWHTAKTARHSKMLFITPGEGTLNEESPD